MQDSARLPITSVLAAAIVRRVMGYDRDLKDMLTTVVAGTFVVVLVAPGVAEYLELGPGSAASMGAVLALVARPMIQMIMRIATHYRDNPDFLMAERKKRDPDGSDGVGRD